MEASLNEPKSKSFNVYLRMFHLGLQLAAAYWAIFYDGTNSCQNQFYDFISYIAYALIFLNFISLIIVRCSSKFPRPYFFLTYLIDLLLAAGACALAIFGHMNHRDCASNIVLFTFSSVQSALTILMTFLILCCELGWSQRYSNSPGNLVWVILLIKSWPGIYKLPLYIIGILYAFISFMTLMINLMTCNGLTSKNRKIVKTWWIIAILLMIGAEVYAIIVYFVQAGQPQDLYENEAKKYLAVFILVNFIDILFWLFGLKTLSYENGDQVRDDLFTGEDHINRKSEGQRKSAYNNNFNNNQVFDESIVIENQIGTVS